MKTLRLLLILTALCSPALAADTPQRLTWDDLMVRLPLSENPFASLSTEQLEALADVAALRDRKARGTELTPMEIATERASAEKLKNGGVDADALLAKRHEIARKMRELAGAVNPKLDGKLVRIAGYLLPLEFSGKKVTEFLLVPWAGACVHTPPPPPNQIVQVKTAPIEIKAMFDPVWVTGRMTTAGGRKSVSFTDGSADVDVGYAINVAQVEPYVDR